jgi:hypothetical protein
MISTRAYASLPTIQRGRHAGQPRPITDIILDALTRARAAVILLKRNGHTVINVVTDSGLPTVLIQASALTAEMIRLEQAVYYAWRNIDGEPVRYGQFQLDGVRVVWIERGYPQ